MTTPAGPYDHRGAYGPEAAPVLPMPDTVTYRCDECGAEISHREPLTAHDLYLAHKDIHELWDEDEDDEDEDLAPLTPAEVLEDEDLAAQYYEDEVPD